MFHIDTFSSNSTKYCHYTILMRLVFELWTDDKFKGRNFAIKCLYNEKYMELKSRMMTEQPLHVRAFTEKMITKSLHAPIPANIRFSENLGKLTTVLINFNSYVLTFIFNYLNLSLHNTNIY